MDKLRTACDRRMQYDIGIDVSKDHLDLAALIAPHGQADAPRPAQHRRFNNTPTGIAALVDHLRRLGLAGAEPSAEPRVVFEATGSYHRRLAAALDASGIAYARINPLQARRYAQMKLRRGKTDRIDAELLARYGREQRPAATPALAPEHEQLKELYRHVRHLVKLRTMLRGLRHASAHHHVHCAEAQEAAEAVIAVVEQQIKRLETAQARLVQMAFPDDARLLESIHGIGPRTSLALLAVCGDLRRFERPKQLSAFLGLNPVLWESGAHKGRVRISKQGHADVRAVLYQGTLSAVRHNSACRALYERLIECGKSKKAARIAVANKLLRQAHAVVRKRELYDDQFWQNIGRAA